MARPDADPQPLALARRALLTRQEAQRVARTFRLLGNQIRIRLLHVLVLEGEVRMSELARRLNSKPQAVSNQLRVLADAGIVARSRRDGKALYRIADPFMAALLDNGAARRPGRGRRTPRAR